MSNEFHSDEGEVREEVKSSPVGSGVVSDEIGVRYTVYGTVLYGLSGYSIR